MNTIAKLNGYTLNATKYGYTITEPEANQEFASFGLLNVRENNDFENRVTEYTVQINTCSFSDGSPEFIARYARALAAAGEAAAYFNTLMEPTKR